ncbi:MAG TPA: LuxR C-terminal-related transcriptional regulator [Vicinamibacterales bacterium]|nr:LuxR C-terminal-related transcriptional regulator [Vicinamibacterales bacterium]
MRNDLSTRMQRFLNAMPLASDSEQWMQEFHRGLKDLLDGVDVVMLTVNLATTTITSEASAASAIVNRPHKSNGPDGRRGSIAGTLRSTPGELLVAQNIQRGFPASHYQKPVILDYHAEGHYVGTIALWRLRSAPTPVPRSTLVLLRSLERFIAFALSDCISRHHNRDASLTTFQAAIERASERIGLTRRELDVFALQLVGLGRTCIAERLGIGVSAVAQHMQSIRRKSGATSLLELFVPF